MSDLYVSSVKGAAVTRYSTMVPGKRAGLLIGAERDSENPKRLTWDTELIVKIPAQEYAQFRKEYDKALHAKCLMKRSEQEYSAQQKQFEEKAKQDAEERATRKREAEEAAAKKAEEVARVSSESDDDATTESDESEAPAENDTGEGSAQPKRQPRSARKKSSAS